MKLVIGGYAQGKLSYVLQKYDMESCQIWDGEIPKNKIEQGWMSGGRNFCFCRELPKLCHHQ